MMKVLAVLTTLGAMRPTDGGVSIVRPKNEYRAYNQALKAEYWSEGKPLEQDFGVKGRLGAEFMPKSKAPREYWKSGCLGAVSVPKDEA